MKNQNTIATTCERKQIVHINENFDGFFIKKIIPTIKTEPESEEVIYKRNRIFISHLSSILKAYVDGWEEDIMKRTIINRDPIDENNLFKSMKLYNEILRFLNLSVGEKIKFIFDVNSPTEEVERNNIIMIAVLQNKNSVITDPLRFNDVVFDIIF